MMDIVKLSEIEKVVSDELSLPLAGVSAVCVLLAEGATVPFIARYRKEKTGALDEVQIRAIEQRVTYQTDLSQRRQSILESIEEQGKLTDALKSRIRRCKTKAELEDLYLPYKKKRRTRAMIAIERGLQPLAERMMSQASDANVESDAAAYIDAKKQLPDIDAVLRGARDIVAERIAENADIRALVRKTYASQGNIISKVARGKENERSKFEDYYDYTQKVRTLPSHRYLAMRRGETEGFLKVGMEVDAPPLVVKLTEYMQLDSQSPYASHLQLATEDSLRRLLAPSVQIDIRVELKLRADQEAVEVFAENLQHLLLAAPYGHRAVIGIDPGLRTGCKCAVVDATGKFVEFKTIHPFRGSKEKAKAFEFLKDWIIKHKPAAIAVGNGTAGRETEEFTRSIVAILEEHKPLVVLISESGASIYSASDIARQEFPDLDLTVRGAISIARRLQDPLAELVKIDPKSIGVGQYQHDVSQTLLQTTLSQVVESCVNRVGVELNTASAQLLAYVAGVGPALAARLVAHREQHGAFKARDDLRKISGLGPVTFEQAAGFLRVRDSLNPLDASAVHPERYDLVTRMARDMGVELSMLVGEPALSNKIKLSTYVDDQVGMPTLTDIINELDKPGRDPRDEFQAPNFRDDLKTIADLHEGMELEGVITNVTHFGAFVDVGVHQDGLVHISQLAEGYVSDPSKVVKVGQQLKVYVINVDIERQRITLSAKSASQGSAPSNPTKKKPQQSKPRSAKPKTRKFSNNPFQVLAGGLSDLNK